MTKQERTALGWHTIEDFVRWAGVEIGDMIRLDVGVEYGFLIGYLQNYTKDSITLTRHRPESRCCPGRPWNKQDKPMTYHVKDMTIFYGISKLISEPRTK